MMPNTLKRTNKFKTQQLLTLFNIEEMRDSNMKAIPDNPKGFSLVEMLVAMAAGLIVMLAINSAYVNYQRSHVTQQLVVHMQQNARAAMSLMKREIRMTGYDPVAADGVDNDSANGVDDAAESSGAGIIEAKYDTASGIPIMRFSADLDYDWTVVGDEDITYTLVGTELQRNGQIVAYDIEAVGFAYAFDDDGDGALDVSDPAGGLVPGNNGNIIWAVDSNLGDHKLDHFLDTDDDGIIDANDTEGGDGMTGQVLIANIRAVRIWLLARTRQPIKGHIDNQTYAVGPLHRGPADGDWDARKRRVLLTTTVYCRNMGI
jgi:type IV pilus assembly protein PilW